MKRADKILPEVYGTTLMQLSTLFLLQMYIETVRYIGGGNRSTGENHRPAASH